MKSVSRSIRTDETIDLRFYSVPTKLASFTLEKSSTVYVYTRSDIKAHKRLPDC